MPNTGDRGDLPAVADAPRRAEPLDRDDDVVEVGQWYWVTSEDRRGERSEWLGCVMEVGSNYAELHTPHSGRNLYSSQRVHFDRWHEQCRREPDPERVINERIRHFRSEASAKMERVKEITASLGVGRQRHLGDGCGVDAGASLVRLSETPDVESHKDALVKAKTEQLPELFEAMKKDHEELVRWTSAETMPLRARAGGLQDVLEKIEGRLFNIELYAGLTEVAERVRDGEPADIHERLHVYQRRLYMDEECLCDYDAGGMEFKQIGHFDDWLCRPQNLERILPHPRSLVAFRVRRVVKDRSSARLDPFVRVVLENQDRMTFLYARNGGQVWRIGTELEFGDKIFPDTREFDPTRLRGKVMGGVVRGFISEDEYQVRLRERDERRRRRDEWAAAHPDGQWFDNPHRDDDHDLGLYERFSPDSVYHDDMVKELDGQVAKYNRVAMIVQGLFDRSPILHPHPPVRLWEGDGMAAAVELVYDYGHALHAGGKPDFEAYRRECNASLKVGSVTVGQQAYWRARELEKVRDAMRRRGVEPKYVSLPLGNPGPGRLARVARFMPRARKCVYEWNRDRQRTTWRGNYGDPIKTTVTVPEGEVLNVDAYEPGDYKRFFADPRTRAEYLKWAPLLLAAEDHHAGATGPVKDGVP